MTILHVHKPSVSELIKVTQLNRPTVITGILDTWSDVMSWNPDYLKEEHGDEVINLDKNITEQDINHIVTARLEEYIDWLDKVEQGKIKTDYNYYFSESLNFLDQLDLEPILNKRFQTIIPLGQRNQPNLTTYAFWLGPKNSVTGFHYDTDHRNYLAQIHGRKQFLLVSPDQKQNMYPNSRYERGSNCSLVKIWRGVDLEKYPNFRKVKIHQVILEPGQLLYVPARWWHAVKNLDTTAAISLRHETWFTNNVIGLAEDLRHKLHCVGLIGDKNNCVCHAKHLPEKLPGTKGIR